MRLIIEAPNGRTYYGASTDTIFLKETMVDEEPPTRCSNPRQVAEIIAKWYENNAYSPFTLETKNGDIHVFPPEILKHCIVTVEFQPDVLKKYVPESAVMRNLVSNEHDRTTKILSGEHESPGFGYEPEDKQEEHNDPTET